MNRLIAIAMFVMNAAYTATARNLIGVCYDGRGCNSCAGYSWCNATQVCHQPWANENILC